MLFNKKIRLWFVFPQDAPNLCGLYPGRWVTLVHVSSVGVPSNLNILSNWS